MAETKATTDHQTIRSWVEEHGGCPAVVKATHSDTNTGIIRIDFPGFSGQDSLEEISWDEFFKEFDAKNLALIYREDSRFNKLVSRESVEQGN